MPENISITGELRQSSSKTSIIAWSVFLTGILYYCFAYLLRVYPSVMQPNLLQHFHMSAGSFGILSSFYYFAYAPLQLPIGVTIDKVGPRRALIFACSVSIVGAWLFAYSDYYAMALVGRFLIGFGSAFAYVTALKLATIWLPARYFATATGAVTGLGMVAAIATDLYLTHLIEVSSFQYALYFPVVIGVILLMLIVAVVREKAQEIRAADAVAPSADPSALSYTHLMQQLLVIVKSQQMWVISIVGALLYLPSSMFLDVWAIPYFETVHHLSPHAAALGVSIMLFGWICSSFLTGALSDLLCTRKIPVVIGSFGAAATIAFILFVPNIPMSALYVLLFIGGAFCGPHPLCFTLCKENHSRKISGTTIAFANFIIMMGGFIFQPVVGKLLDWVSHGVIENGLHIYSAADYVAALSIMPIGLCIAGVLSLFIKETYRKSTHDKH
jgi:sugar phosphate permease